MVSACHDIIMVLLASMNLTSLLNLLFARANRLDFNYI